MIPYMDRSTFGLVLVVMLGLMSICLSSTSKENPSRKGLGNWFEALIRFNHLYSKVQDPQPHHIRLVSFNVHMYSSSFYDGRIKVKKFLDPLIQYKPSIILLHGVPKTKGFITRQILEDYDYKYITGCYSENNQESLGNLIFVKSSITAKAHGDRVALGNWGNAITISIQSKGADELFLVATHIYSSYAKNANNDHYYYNDNSPKPIENVDSILNLAKAFQSPKRVMIAGDFSGQLGQYTRERLQDCGFANIYETLNVPEPVLNSTRRKNSGYVLATEEARKLAINISLLPHTLGNFAPVYMDLEDFQNNEPDEGPTPPLSSCTEQENNEDNGDEAPQLHPINFDDSDHLVASVLNSLKAIEMIVCKDHKCRGIDDDERSLDEKESEVGTNDNNNNNDNHDGQKLTDLESFIIEDDLFHDSSRELSLQKWSIDEEKKLLQKRVGFLKRKKFIESARKYKLYRRIL